MWKDFKTPFYALHITYIIIIVNYIFDDYLIILNIYKLFNCLLTHDQQD